MNGTIERLAILGVCVAVSFSCTPKGSAGGNQDSLTEGVSSMEELEARMEALENGINIPENEWSGMESEQTEQAAEPDRKAAKEIHKTAKEEKMAKKEARKAAKEERRALRAARLSRRNAIEEEPQNDSIPALGFWEEDYMKEDYTVRSGETFSGALDRLGMNRTDAYGLVSICDTVFDVRKFRAGNHMHAYFSGDSLNRRLEYLVYMNDRIRSTIFKCSDSLAVWTYDKPVEIRTRYSDITIEESLWNDMIKAGASPLLIVDLADVYAWTVDFFTLRQGDRFRAFYTEKAVDDEVIAIDGIQYSLYNRGDYELSAIYYDQGDGGNKYWNEKGESMRKAFLKAPLKFNRVSSRFTYHRKHPISGVVKPHTGVDYAAPAGTPVRSIGDGTVVSAGWGGGGGNTVKIKHNSVYSTAYLHLKSFAKGIKAGAKVHQGDVIGYVGSTGASTGPHLDFRVWKNGTPIDPLKMESPSAEPAKKENLSAIDSLYHTFRNRIESGKVQ